MSSDNVSLSVKQVSKYFEMYSRPVHRLMQALAMGKTSLYKEFWALRNISFDLMRGECIGIIGRNGAGKSTLLQIITGTLQPTNGSVQCNGRVAALLELGSGFNPQFSGRDNVYLNAAILGLSKTEINQKYDEIVEFADIGDFIHQPVKTYSSGMLVRLAFSVYACIDPDILIIDEALAVGDIKFQVKCFDRLRKFRANGGSILFVSHDLNTVNTFCDRSCYLKNGKLIYCDESRLVTTRYYNDMFNQSTQELNESGDTKESADLNLENVVGFHEVGEAESSFPFKLPSPSREKVEATVNREIELGDGGVRVMDYGIYNANGQKVTETIPSDNYYLHVRIVALRDTLDCAIGYLLRDKAGRHIFSTSNYISEKTSEKLKKGEIMDVFFKVKIPLINHAYLLGIGLAEKEGHYFEFLNDCLQLNARQHEKAFGNSWLNVENHTIFGKKWKSAT